MRVKPSAVDETHFVFRYRSNRLVPRVHFTFSRVTCLLKTLYIARTRPRSFRALTSCTKDPDRPVHSAGHETRRRPQEVPALAATMARGLRRGGAMVNDSALAEAVDGQQNLVEAGVVGDRVALRPVEAY